MISDQCRVCERDGAADFSRLGLPLALLTSTPPFQNCNRSVQAGVLRCLQAAPWLRPSCSRYIRARGAGPPEAIGEAGGRLRIGRHTLQLSDPAQPWRPVDASRTLMAMSGLALPLLLRCTESARRITRAVEAASTAAYGHESYYTVLTVLYCTTPGGDN